MLLGMAKKTLQNRVSMGASVPSYIGIPGYRGRWLREDVEQWVLDRAGGV